MREQRRGPQALGHFDDGFAVADGDAADGSAAEAAGVGDGR